MQDLNTEPQIFQFGWLCIIKEENTIVQIKKKFSYSVEEKTTIEIKIEKIWLEKRSIRNNYFYHLRFVYVETFKKTCIIDE